MKRTKIVLSCLTAATLMAAANQAFGDAHVVISQVYGGGGNNNGLYRNDFIELFNRGDAPQSLAGWSVQYHSATATTTTGAWQVTNLGNFMLQPGQHYLIQEAIGAGTSQPALPTPDAIGTIAMGAGGGHIALVSSTTALASPPPNGSIPYGWHSLTGVMDYVGYGSSASVVNDYEGLGGAPMPAVGATANANAAVRFCNGCQDIDNNAADFTFQAPSAHNSDTLLTPLAPCGTPIADLTLAPLTNSGCNPAVGSAYSILATSTNSTCNSAPALHTMIRVVLPTNLTYTGSTTSSGTSSYDSLTRTVSVDLGTLNPGAPGSLTVNATVNAAGGICVVASTSTDVPESSYGNNTNNIVDRGSPGYNVAVNPANPLYTIALEGVTNVTLATDTVPIDTTLSTIGRPYRSPDGTKFIMRCETALSPATDNTCVIVGSIDNLGAVTYTVVARENYTKPAASLTGHKIKSASFNNLLSINNSGQYAYTCVLTDGVPANDKAALVKGTVGVAGNTCMLQGDPVPAASGITGAFTNFQSSSIQSNGTVSFLGTFGTGTTDAAFFSNDGNNVLVRKGVTVPTGQAGGGTAVMATLDDDAGGEAAGGQGVRLSENGVHWIATGALAGATNTKVVLIDGAVVNQEGSPVVTNPPSGFTDGAGWHSFSAVAGTPFVSMDADSSWYIQGYNPATAGFNQGQDWVERSGQIIAKTGDPITPGSTETWADNIIQRTFFMAFGNGGDYAVNGLTNRSTSIPDLFTDEVIVLNNSTVVLRENQPVNIGTSGSPTLRYIDITDDNRAFIGANRVMYVSVVLREPNNVCTSNYNALPHALVAVPLPATVCSPADIGVQGGTFGHDNLLNNNDFVVFINLFFSNDPYADLGVQGGTPGHDGNFDNNDFIVFINIFFEGQANCLGTP